MFAIAASSSAAPDQTEGECADASAAIPTTEADSGRGGGRGRGARRSVRGGRRGGLGAGRA